MSRNATVAVLIAAALQPGAFAQEPVTISAFERQATSLTFSPDGKALAATGPGERSARVWDAESGKPLKTFTPAEGLNASQILFAADGKSLALRARGRASELAAGAPQGRRPAPPVPVLWTVWETFDFNTGKRTSSTDLGGAFSRAEQSRDGKLLALRRFHYEVADGVVKYTHRARHEIVLYDLETKRQLLTLETWEPSVDAFVFTPDGKTLLLADKGGVVRLVDTETGKDRAVLESLDRYGRPRELWLKKGGKPEDMPRRSPITGLSLSADGKLLATSHDGNERPQVFDLTNGSARLLTRERLRRTTGDPRSSPWEISARTCVVSPDGKVVAAGGGLVRLALFDATSGKLRANYDTGEAKVELIAFSPDGKAVAAAMHDGTIQVWPVPTGEN